MKKQNGYTNNETTSETSGPVPFAEMLRRLFSKYRSLIAYLFFGGCTTVVNVAVYFACYNVVHIPNVVSTAIAWLLSVIFAFITNKLWVFDSKSFSAATLKYEIPTFFGARIFTGILDIVIMYVAVDILKMNSTLWKLISNVLVIILNYFASRLIVFRKKK